MKLKEKRWETGTVDKEDNDIIRGCYWEDDLIECLDGEIARIQEKLDSCKYATERVYEGGRLKALKTLREELGGKE